MIIKLNLYIYIFEIYSLVLGKIEIELFIISIIFKGKNKNFKIL